MDAALDALLETKKAERVVLPPRAERRQIRERAGLSQEELAGLVGCSQWTVLRWEYPEGHPRATEPPKEFAKAYQHVLRALERKSSK